MREYKFRGKPTENNTSYFEDEDFVYGSLIISEDKYYILLDVLDNIKRDDYAVYMVEVRPETIGQYTGLKDRNMKEIYEGDIVKFRFKEDREEFPDLIGYIEYQSTFAAFRIMSNQGSFKIDITEIKFIEKIGNIYDNPELLEEGE